MLNITIIGNGEIGKAIEHVIDKDAISDLYIWDKKEGALKSEKLQHADVIFLCIPSQAVREVISTLSSKIKKTAFVVCLSKGLEASSSKFMYEILKEFISEDNIAILGGPMIAEEVKHDMGTVGVLASTNKEIFNTVKNIFLASKIRLEYSSDISATALFAVLKNIYTLMIGISIGCGYSKNIQGWLTVQALKEWRAIANALNIDSSRIYDNDGLGDFIATSSSHLSKNRSSGIKIAEGKKPEKSEGFASLPAILVLLPSGALESMPILNALKMIITDKKPARTELDKIVNK